jgi:hypothetical protein
LHHFHPPTPTLHHLNWSFKYLNPIITIILMSLLIFHLCEFGSVSIDCFITIWFL